MTLRLPAYVLIVTIGAIAHAAPAPSVAYLGTTPQPAGQPPIAARDVHSFGVDADGNRYFSDAANGTVIRVKPDGSHTSVASGLKIGLPQATLAVDYRGNVCIADPGNHRILSVAAGTATSNVRAALSASTTSLAVDTVGDCFYLSGSQLYQLPPAGQPRPVANVAGAFLIAYGPASNEDDTIYILSTTAAHAYTVSTFTYHNGAGRTAVDRTFTTPAAVSSMVVDAARNLILATETGGSGSLQQVAPGGQTTVVTSTGSGAAPLLALDYNRNLLYLDSSGIFSIMPGAVNFGRTEGPYGGSVSPVSMQLVVALPPGQAITTSENGDFSDSFDPSSDCNWPGNLCHITVSFYPQTLGLETGDFLVQDQSGNTLLSVPLYGNGLYPLQNMFQASGPALSTPLSKVNPDLPAAVKTAAGISPTNANLPVLVTDVGTGELVTLFTNGVKPTTGLGRPQTVAQYPFTATYVTQTGMSGILRIDQNGNRSRVAERLAGEPNDVAIDDIGNLYIADQNAVFRVGIDGTETPLAVPGNDGGYERADSIAVNGTGDVYTYFHAGGPSGSGGLVKITPAGSITPIVAPEGVRAGTSMALDSGGGLYISDGLSRTLSTIRTDDSSLTLIAGLKVPKGVSGYAWPAIIDQGTDSYIQPTLPNSAFDFGSVPIGESVTRTYTLVALGNEPSTVDFYFGPDSQFTISSHQVNIAPGGSAQFSITFKPTRVGAHNAELDTSSNDFNLPDGSPGSIPLNGTGIAK